MSNNFGCFKSSTSDNDYLMRSYLDDIPLPVKFDISDEITPIRNQGKEGSCVGFATVTGVKEYQEQRDYSRFIELSPRFLYEEAKKLSGHKEGTTLKAAMKVALKKGVCEERFWPYQVPQILSKYPNADLNAEKYKIKTYARITNLRELKRSLVQYGAILAGIKVFKSIKDTKEDGIVPTPNRKWPSNWKPAGSHAVCIIGYDDEKELIKFKNSWGEKWGHLGYGFLTYNYIKRYMQDCFSCVDILDPNPWKVRDLLPYEQKYAWI